MLTAETQSCLLYLVSQLLSSSLSLTNATIFCKSIVTAKTAVSAYSFNHATLALAFLCWIHLLSFVSPLPGCFFPRLFMANFTHHPLSRNHSTVPTFIIQLISFWLSESKPLPILSIVLWRNSLYIFMQYPFFSSDSSLKHCCTRNLLNSVLLRLLVPCDHSLSCRSVLPLPVTLLSFACDGDSQI